MGEEEEREKIKKIAKLRALLEKRVEAMEEEMDGLKTLLSLIDSTLLKEGFKRAEISKPIQPPPKEATPKPSGLKQKKGIPLKTITGNILAQIYIEKDSMQVALAEDKNFDINTPPFTSFLVERVLAKMQEKDREAASKGKIAPEKMLDYNIKRDGNIIREIDIRNIKPGRSRELKSSIRWTLEKMYERMKQTN
ncbi:MAG: hypothetical protein JSW14_06075 [Candidatus Bathyarchaeum sp.]|nr:MAG: hypothetical protein JSW14_06075 [Candidatus Bathyarchaeum sp.]